MVGRNFERPRMNAKIRKTSNFLFRKFLESIRFAPLSTNDSYVSGIHQRHSGLGGMGYSYWKCHAVLELYRHLSAVRIVVGSEISLIEAQSLFDDFCSQHIQPIIAGRFEWQADAGSLLECLNETQIVDLQSIFFEFATTFSSERIFWIPLNSVDGTEYKGKSLSILKLPEVERASGEEVAQYISRIPALQRAKRFACVKARNFEHAKERTEVLTGALFLCMHPGMQYSHTMARPSQGLLCFDRNWIYRETSPHIPALSSEILVLDEDVPFLTRVDDLMINGDNNRKLLRAMRWLGFSWFANGAERFALHCQALDALCPNEFSAMREKCSWACDVLGGTISMDAIELLFKKIRSDVAHGDAPSLIESRYYLKFLQVYEVDPQLAVVEIARKIIIDSCFPEVRLQEHPLSRNSDAFNRVSETFSRYGLEYRLPTGFDFSKLAQA